MRRFLTAALVGLTVAGALPAGVLAAAPTAQDDVATIAEDTPATVTLTATDGGGGDVTDFVIVPASGTGGTAGTPTAPVCVSGTCTAGVLFSPDADYSGAAGFQFTALGPDGTSNQATISITVQPVNDAPAFTPGGDVTVNEDSGAYSAAWATAISPGPNEAGQTLNFIVGATNLAMFQTAPAISPTGTLTFQPKAQWSGSSTVTVSLHDDGGLEDYGIPGVVAHDTSAEVQFTLIVTAVNDAPAPAPGNATVPEDTQWLIPVSASDVDGDPTTAFALASGPSHGSVDLSAAPVCNGLTPNTCTGSAIYTPALDYTGPDSFTYTAADATSVSGPATVTITVTPNNAPVCVDASSSASEDTQQSGAITCTDADGHTLTYAKVASPSHGTATVNANGSWTYTPTANYNGPDSFTFKANDGQVNSGTATMSITVVPVNDLPVCSGGSSSGAEEALQTGTLTCTDADPADTLTYSLVAGAAHGTATVDADGTWHYAPNLNSVAADSFTFKANDGHGDSNIATMSITVTPVNDAPTCSAASSSGAEDTGQSGTITCTDPDPGDTLTYTRLANASHGSATVNANGSWTYTPTANYNGPDSFTFRANDGQVNSGSATMSITVTAVNDAPVCSAASSSGAEDANQTGTITCTDVDLDSLTYAKVAGPSHGSATVNANGSWTYTPTANYNGPDSFTFRANDGTVDSGTSTMSLTITDVNDAPDARNDAIAVNATTTTTLSVLANDVSGPKIDGATSEPLDAITVTSVTAAGKGSVSIAPGGTGIIYDPRGCATGTDLFSYTIKDSQGLADTASVIVTIARPGENGLSSTPITDLPGVGLVSGATMGSTVPTRVNWCGVTKSGVSLSGYRVDQSSNGGASYGTSIFNTSKATSATRSLAIGTSYRWRVLTVDAAKRKSPFKYSAVTRLGRLQENNAGVTYTGSWSTTKTTKASGGAMRSATSTSATVTFTITNVRQFAIVGPRTSKLGSFLLYVDGKYVATIKERASTTAYRKVLTVRSVTPGVSHTVELRPAGNGRVYLDAIVTLQ